MYHKIQKEKAEKWFTHLRNHLCKKFEKIEAEYMLKNHPSQQAPTFIPETWKRQGGGGGTMSLMKGNVFEKIGVNISTVHGKFSDEFAAQIPGTKNDKTFWACGVSVVAHPKNPLVPAGHMNTRHIITEQNWFGGGADLTPTFPEKKQTQAFHQALKKTCDAYQPHTYEKFKEECERYFFLPHRNISRGVGGIFYDYLQQNWEQDFQFTQNVGLTFGKIYDQIVREKMHQPYTPQQRHQQLVKRGQYAEFNLLYDRGTKFGLMTGGNTKAILMSLPPKVIWE